MATQWQQLEAGIAALEAQRAVLGDEVVDLALGPLKARMATLASVQTRQPAQSLKQVSILFLDVVGSTSLSQHLDPEDTSAVMDGALRRGTAIVQAHGGRVVQYAGDSILAAFGAAGAAEDDAERAVRCGLSLLELGRELSAEVLAAHGYEGCNVRVGIHTGGVLLGGGGGGVGDESAMRGLAVNVAARMEQTAPAGALRISRDTYQQVRGLFDVALQPPLAVKGVDEPLVSFLVLKAKARSFRHATRGIEGVATRMVGRDAEFKALQDVFKRLYTERRWMAVTVVADAGIGKSRLLDEFQAWTEAQAEQPHLFRGRATPQTQGQPFGLLRDIVAWWLALSDDDTMDRAKAKVEQGVMPLFAEAFEFAQGHAHLLGHLIGLDWKDSPHLRDILDDPRQIRNRARHAAAQVFRRISARDGAPVVLQLEDLHWADDESLDFLTYLAEVSADAPLLVLAFTRPTLFERRGDGLGKAGYPVRIDLQPLDNDTSGALVDELLKQLPEVPTALRELITGGAEGNPFYMEELVRMLIDQGAIDVSGERWQLQADRLQATRVPTTLTGVLQARLDGLPAQERLTLQEASVIGQIFWDRALLALDDQTETALVQLVRRELALPRQEAAFDGLREYAFKHALLHQVTYDTLLKRQRRLLHGRLADWLAAHSQSNGARASDFLGLTAQHYQEAGEDANAAEFHARAAEHALDRLAHGTVLSHVQQAFALLDRTGDSPSQSLLRWRLLRAREVTLGMQGHGQQQEMDIDALECLAQALGDDVRRAYAVYRRTGVALSRSRFAEAEQGARQVVALADAALARADGSAGSDGTTTALHLRRLSGLRQVGVALMNQGRLDEAQPLLEQTLSAARDRQMLKLQALCLNSLSVLVERRGDTVGNLALGRDCLNAFRRAGDRRFEAIGLGNVGAALLNLGHLSAARRDLEDALKLISQTGERGKECGPLCALSELVLLQGQAAQALALAGQARGLAVDVLEPDWEVVASVYQGHAEAALGQRERAAQAYAHAQQVAERISSAWQFDARAGLARLDLAGGDIAGAVQALSPLWSTAVAQAPADAAVQAGADARSAQPGESPIPPALAAQLDSAIAPRLIDLTAYRVLSAAQDGRATAWLRRAHRALMVQADAINDAALRQMFLSNIPQHRDIVSLWAAPGRPL
jgi:class 3 adenylate cyclase/tetratricopeptide (TPR) repeat protein